jgi:methionyl-tRNA synthetase
MGNDENTLKVAGAAQKLGQDVKAYCDEMARQFKEVWAALDISYDEFVQTSEPRHHRCAQRFIQKVYDNGYIYKGSYEGWYCEGCEGFKTETDAKENDGKCPIHQTPLVRRSEPCYFFAQSKFQERLLQFYEDRKDFIQPESRRNEMLRYVEGGLEDVNITRSGQSWGIPVPFDPEFTIWVWFDALLTYFTGIGYATDDEKFAKWWPADIHFIGKDITRFHCALWPAMLFAAGLEPPRLVFSHGFVYRKVEETGALEKYSKTLGNIVDPMEIIPLFGADAFRYYFLRECPFPGDGEFSKERYGDIFNADLANNLGNLYSRGVTLIAKNYGGHLQETARREPGVIYTDVDTESAVQQVQKHIEACQYNQALEKIWRLILDPTNQYADRKEPWKLVKTDKTAASHVLYDIVEQLRIAAILLKPFLPCTARTIYRSFNFPQRWEEVRYEDVWVRPTQVEDLRVLAPLEDGKVKPLFPRIS